MSIIFIHLQIYRYKMHIFDYGLAYAVSIKIVYYENK